MGRDEAISIPLKVRWKSLAFMEGIVWIEFSIIAGPVLGFGMDERDSLVKWHCGSDLSCGHVFTSELSMS